MSGPLLVQLSAADMRAIVADAVAVALRQHDADKAPSPLLVGPCEMARRLDVSRTTLHRLRLDGCPAVAIGDVFKYEPAAVLTWLRDRKSVAA